MSLNKHLFSFACFEFRFRLDEATELPAYKGALLHGALGHALEAIGTGFRDYFYSPRPPQHWLDRGQAPPRPYMLIPPADEKIHYLKDEILALGIILYGDAINHFMIIFAALGHMGERMGLGKDRGHFRIESVCQIGLEQAQPIFRNGAWLQTPQALSADYFFKIDYPEIFAIRLKHATRLRLKTDNCLMRKPPPFSLLLERLLGRINTLAAMYCGGMMITPDEKRNLLVMASTVTIERSTLQWSDWERFSQRSQEAMPFGGLLGETVYRGELAPFLPWLNLGQWTGVGGKTSFGLGHYVMEIKQ